MHKNTAPGSAGNGIFSMFRDLSLCAVSCAHALAEQQGNAPQAGKTHKGVDDPAEDGILTAKQPCYKVELKNAHKAPVKGTDNGQDQC